MDNYIQIPNIEQLHASLKVLIDTLNFYIKENKDLVEILYAHGIEAKEIAAKRGVSKSAISLRYPKNQKKGGE